MVRKSSFIKVAGFAWFVLLTAGTAAFLGYENKAGVAAASPTDWPTNSGIQRPLDRATLLVFTHPHCPCTRATLHELERLTADTGDRLAVFVLFIKPDGVEADWEKTDIAAIAAAIPGVTVLTDRDGFESQLFDAHTSGQSMLFDQHGKLLFSGGVTTGRGQEGPSTGSASIVALVKGVTPAVTETNVFGCPLFSHEKFCRGGHVNNDAQINR